MGAVAPEGASAPPLARLFAIAYRQLIDGLHERLRELGWTDVRESFGFVLLAARDQPTSITELSALMRISKQAASKLVDVMAGCGYVSRGADPEDGRQRPVTLTGRGRELLAAVEQIYAELEGHWAQVIGVSQVDSMRRDLLRVVSGSGSGPGSGPGLGSGAGGGQLPPVRPPT